MQLGSPSHQKFGSVGEIWFWSTQYNGFSLKWLLPPEMALRLSRSPKSLINSPPATVLDKPSSTSRNLVTCFRENMPRSAALKYVGRQSSGGGARFASFGPWSQTMLVESPRDTP